MARNTRTLSGISPAQVFAALRDGASYDQWVVGTRKIRDVDLGWPAPTTAIHYTIGYAPFRKDGETVVKAINPDRQLELEAKAWPAGTLRINITADPIEGGCEVAIEEHPLRGPAKVLHNPVADLLIKLRNVETLRRLEKRVRELARAS
jgi:hypothetical protein